MMVAPPIRRSAAIGCVAPSVKALLLPRIVRRNLRILAGFAPEDDLVAPWIFEGVIVAVEFLPIVVAPEKLGAALGGALQDIVRRIAVADEYPDARLAAVAAELARCDAFALGMGARIGGFEDAEMEI